MAMTELFTTYFWVIWVVLILVFVIIEVATVDFTFVMIAVGSVGGLVTGAVGGPFWLQVVVAAVVSILLIFTLRPPLLRALKRGGDPTPTNVEALLGQSAVVVVAMVDRFGQVKLANGETWTARLLSPEGASSLDTGSAVVVTAIEGSTAIVVPSERKLP
jgi:membrane protein implicated in regulation of membrane protease activity